MSKHIIEFDEKCKSCKGSGIYVGICERDGSGVVCHTCKGKGCHHVKIEYEDFEGKHIRKDIKHVVEVNPGICIGTGNRQKLSDFGGMTYKDWLSGKSFELGNEMRKFVCPAWWYQAASYILKPKWDECIIAGRFSKCECFSEKEKCWERFDKEISKGESHS